MKCRVYNDVTFNHKQKTVIIHFNDDGWSEIDTNLINSWTDINAVPVVDVIVIKGTLEIRVTTSRISNSSSNILDHFNGHYISLIRSHWGVFVE